MSNGKLRLIALAGALGGALAVRLASPPAAPKAARTPPAARPAPKKEREKSERPIAWPLPPVGAARARAAERGRQLFFDLSCWRCHKLGDEMLPGTMDAPNAGPDLLGVGARLSLSELAESLLNPSAVIAEPQAKHISGKISKMPAFPNVTTGELMDLLVFLSRLKGPPPPQAKARKE